VPGPRDQVVAGQFEPAAPAEFAAICVHGPIVARPAPAPATI
jgi:hypothetical protein